MSKRSPSLNCNSNSYGTSPDIWASMRPIRVPYEEPQGSDARMLAAYKKAHASDAAEATTEMSIIRRGKYCSKCLLHVKVCRAYAENLKMAELAAEILKTKDTNIQTEADNEATKKAKAKPESEGGAVEAEETKEN